jgi:hypothetical protein
MIQSTLFKSPYSGCPAYPGWCEPFDKLRVQPLPWVPRTPTIAPGSILSVDPTRKAHCTGNNPKGALWSRQGPPHACIRYVGPVQGGKFTLAGPSTTGPWTIIAPTSSSSGDEYSVSNAPSSGRLG